VTGSAAVGEGPTVEVSVGVRVGTPVSHPSGALHRGVGVCVGRRVIVGDIVCVGDADSSTSAASVSRALRVAVCLTSLVAASLTCTAA
jgi:hypothetical protein